MTIIMKGVNSSVGDRVHKPFHSNYHSEGAQEDQKKQQHQQFVQGLNENTCLLQKDKGKQL